MNTETWWIPKNIKYKGLRMTMIKNVFGNTSLKVNWQGEIVAIQPRTRVWRYFTDNRTHYHLGYNFFKEGKLEDASKMIKKGFNMDDIIEITGLRREDIERIYELNKAKN